MRWLFLTLVLFTLKPLYGQEFQFRQAPLFQEEEVQHINLLFQSRDHMVWVGTERGVFAFDGRKYQPITRPDRLMKSVTALAEDPDGGMWAGYEDGFLHTFTLRGLNQKVSTDSLEGATISTLLFLPGKEVIICTYGRGVWLLQNKHLSRIRFQSLAAIDDIYDALIDQQGRIWLATDNGIWIYNHHGTPSLSHLDRSDGLPDEIITELEEARNGDVWIGLYDHGLARYILSRDTVISLMGFKSSHGHIKGMVSGRADDVWICREKNIAMYTGNGMGHEIQFPGDIQDRLENLLYDNSGNLWLASGNKIFIANSQFEFIKPDLTDIQAIAVDDTRLWLGCERGLFEWNLESGIARHLLPGEKINILSIYIDPTGFLWIGTFGQGVYIFNPKTNEYRHISEDHALSSNSVLNIDGRNRSVWLATLGGITEISWTHHPMKDDLNIITFQEKFRFPAGYVYDVYVAEDGKVWFGTDGKGLYYLEDNQLRPFVFRGPDVSQHVSEIKTIYSITSDADQNLWISGTKGHILHLKPTGHLLQSISSSQGSLHSMITSGAGEILMIRDGAIQIMGEIGKGNLYTEFSGLESFTHNINATARGKDGSLWIAGTDLILHYIPFQDTTPQAVYMHLEYVSPGMFQLDGPIRLKPDSNFLDVRFTGLWYKDPESIRYRYKLNGHDPDWIYTREGRAVYSRLSPGTYTFIVEGSYNDDYSAAIPLKRDFIVLPPFYMRWWFILGVSLLISWIVFTYILARIKRIKQLHQLEKEKTMFKLHAIQAQVNPHFLFNSFNTLSNIIEEDQEAAVDYVDQLSGFFRGVLMHRDAELIRIEDEMNLVRNYAYILQKRYGENLQILEEIQSESGWIAPLSIQLLVENAIKHNAVSRNKPLTIRITIDDRWVKVSNPVQPKLQPSSESTGFGLTSLVTRYQYLTPMKIEIRAEQNTFTVQIPVIQTDSPL